MSVLTRFATMAEVQAKALYEFTGDPDGGELSFQQDELLVIIRQDIGDGWWEARSQSGKQGLIPESYVEIVSLPEPSFPPPPPPAPSQVQDNHYGYSYYDDKRSSISQPIQQSAPPKQPSFDDWDDDDDWDDYDDDDASSCGTAQNVTNNNHHLDTQSIQSHDTKNSGIHATGYGTVKKNYSSPLSLWPVSKFFPLCTSDLSNDSPQSCRNFPCRAVKRSASSISQVSRDSIIFSQFSRTGGESFMMGQLTGSVAESDCVKIIEGPYGLEWEVKTQYTCELKDPKKESKLKGLKSYMAYQLTPSFSNFTVSRRYKHFDWLHERLEEKFPCIPVPPLPEKAISGRYEDDFVNERMKLLQRWVTRMVRHPIISRCEVFFHFLTCSDEKKWKQGKRKAEKDEYMGGRFFLTLRAPSTKLDMTEVDQKMENFVKFVRGMDDNVKHLLNIFHDNMKKHQGPFKREYQKIGGAFKNLATTFGSDDLSYSKNLTTAIDQTGDAYNKIGEMYANQPQKDSQILADGLNEYKGILSVYPDVLKVHEGAVGKAKECQKQVEDAKITESEMLSILQRADIISFGTLAEMTHFQKERVVDFKIMMQAYLKQQIIFYQEITSKLEESLKMYENA